MIAIPILTLGFLGTLLAGLFAGPARAEGRPPVRSLLEMRQERVVIQAWDLSCGAAALATVLTYDLDDPVTEIDVALAMLGGKDPERVHAAGGFSLLDLKRFAEGRGHSGRGLGKLTTATVGAHLPAIVPTTRNGVSHFVVLRAIADGRAMIADPAFGRYSMPLERFAAIWPSGIALEVRRRDTAGGGLPSEQTALRPSAGIIRQTW